MTAFYHFNFNVLDLERSLAFYREAQERLRALQKVEQNSPLIPIHSAEEAGSQE